MQWLKLSNALGRVVGPNEASGLNSMGNEKGYPSRRRGTPETRDLATRTADGLLCMGALKGTERGLRVACAGCRGSGRTLLVRRRAYMDMTNPGVQNPHCEPWAAASLACGSAEGGEGEGRIAREEMWKREDRSSGAANVQGTDGLVQRKGICLSGCRHADVIRAVWCAERTVSRLHRVEAALLGTKSLNGDNRHALDGVKRGEAGVHGAVSAARTAERLDPARADADAGHKHRGLVRTEFVRVSRRSAFIGVLQHT